MNQQLHLQVGGTLNPRRHIYVERKEDETLFQLLLQSEYVNILSPRQMGKSSLMMRTVYRLDQQGIRWVTIDLASELGSPPDLDIYYLGLLSKITRSLGIAIDLITWWKERGDETINQRLIRFFREVVGGTIASPIVIFLDEIDSTLKLSYTDDLFTAIRGMYNERAMVDTFRRISFCLIGVATPNELIKNRRTTAYNVGTTIALQDFDKSVDNLSPLVTALGSNAESSARLLDRVLYWTGGQPYLTQRFCADIIDRHIDDPAAVDKLVAQTFENLGQAGNDVHFQQVLRFLEERLSNEAATIELYDRVLAGVKVPDRTTLASAELKLSGLVKRNRDGDLVLRNPIYARLFDSTWVRSTRPSRALSKARRYAIVASTALSLLGAIGGTYYAVVIRPEQQRLAVLDRLAALKVSITRAEDGNTNRVTLPDNADQSLLREAGALLKSIGSISELGPPGFNPSPDAEFEIGSVQPFKGEIDNLLPLEDLTELRALDLRQWRVKDISALAGLKQLRTLRVGAYTLPDSRSRATYPLADISPLKNLTALEELQLFATKISDVGPISSMRELRYLGISATDVSDLTPLHNLQSLETFAAWGTEISILDPISNSPKLSILVVSDTSVSDVRALGRLTQLNRLSLGNTRVADVAPLADLIRLKTLDLNSTRVTSIKPLANCINLENLDLSYTKISDITALAGLSNLQALNLIQSGVTDLRPLANLSKLRSLYLRNTPVTDVTVLKGLAGLKSVDLTGTKVPEEQVAELKRTLSQADITSDFDAKGGSNR
jgi:Leucine-rich repeat (LRR) protein